MKKRNVLALALAAGIVLGGANTAFAEESHDEFHNAGKNLTTIDDYNAKQGKEETPEEDKSHDAYHTEKEGKKVTIDDWLKNQKQEEETPEEETPEEDMSHEGYHNKKEGKKVTIDQWLENQKQEETPETPEKPEEKPEEDQGKKVTIDEWNLNEAKKEAIAELEEAGITSDFFLNQIRKAKTVEGVETLKNELLKSHSDSNKEEEKPGKEDDKKVVIPGYKIEDIAKPSKEDKENGTYKPGYATREEAEKAAKEALKNIKTKDSYTIFVDADGRYGYYLWNSKDEKEAEKAAKIKEASKENEKAKEGKASTPAAKSSNPNAAPKTGVAGMSAVAGLAAVSVAGIIATRKKED